MLTTIEKVLFLQRVALLREVPTEALAHLASLASEEQIGRGGRLWSAGDPAEDVYFVVDGEIVLRDGPAIMARALPATDLGTASLVTDGAVREISAHATAPTTLLRVSRDEFFEVLGEHPGFAQALLAALGRRLRPESLRLEAEPLSLE